MAMLNISVFVLIAAVLLIVGMRWIDAVPTRLGFLVFALCLLVLAGISAYLGVLAVTRHTPPSLAFWLSAPFLVLLLFYLFKGLSSPAIHDIATRYDPDIRFEFAQKARSEDDNSLTRDSELRASEDTYKLATASFQAKPRAIVEQVRAYAESQSWSLLGESNADGQMALEYSVTTSLFKFVDDIRIEIREVDGETLVDARSLSRLGKSDLGANAARITALLKELG